MKAHEFSQIATTTLALILLTVCVLDAGATDGLGRESEGHSRQLLVRFEPGLQAAGRSMAHAELGTARAHRFRRIPVDVVTVPQGANLPEYIAAYEARPDVANAEPNYSIQVQSEPNDPLFDNLWGLHNTGQTGGTPGADIGALEAWEYATGSGEVIVAVPDTGVDYNHEDLAENMWENPQPSPRLGDIHGARWTDGDGTLTSGDPMDENSHGTHVAGTIGAVGNNELGVVGVNWVTQLMALRFMDEEGMGSVSDAVAAIEYAIEHGADIINASWGTEDRSDTLKAILQEAADAEVLVVASAGNNDSDNDETPFYPASFDLPNIISVASSTDEDARSSFSNWGKESVHLAAPGSLIKSTIPGNEYGYKAGTSMAAPHVSGAAALFWSVNPEASYGAVKDRILETVTPLEAWEDRVIAGGRLNAGTLLDTAISTGELTVTIEPEAAVEAGAQWRVVGEQTWRNSGERITLGTGEYEVEFAELEDWVKPSPLDMDVTEDTVTSDTVEYERAQGSLEVRVTPEGAREDGAQWRVVGEQTWLDSGERITLDTGEYEVEFAELEEEWVEPSPVSVNIVKHTVTLETVEYEHAQGSLEVNIEPEGARQDGAQWRVAGEALWQDSSEQITVDIGEYEVEFARLDYWVTPEPLSVEVQPDAVTAESVEYERGVGILEVILEPPEAVEDGAQWTVDHGATLHKSGETVEVEAGEHWIMFTPVRQWKAPEARRVEVLHDRVTTEHATYQSTPVAGVPVSRPAGLAVLASVLLAAGLAALTRTRVQS